MDQCTGGESETDDKPDFVGSAQPRPAGDSGTRDVSHLPALLDRAGQQAAHEVTLHGEEDRDGHRHGDEGRRGKDFPIAATRTEHFDDLQRSAPLRRVYEALCSMEIDALVSIGGDDTLKTANKLKLYQERLPSGAHRSPIVHLPTTIDNDYRGMDFTCG